MMRAKFKVDAIKQVSWSNTLRIVTMTAVSADEIPENQRYHKYTPAGTLEINIDNPEVTDKIKMGDVYYLDFTPAAK